MIVESQGGSTQLSTQSSAVIVCESFLSQWFFRIQTTLLWLMTLSYVENVCFMKEVNQRLPLVTARSFGVSVVAICAYLVFDLEIHMTMQCVHLDLLGRQATILIRSVIFEVLDEIFLSVTKVLSDTVSKFQGIYLAKHHQEFGPRK